MKKFAFLFLLFFMSFKCSLFAQGEGKIVGPVVEDFGSTWEIPDVGFQIPEGQEFKMIFDVASKSRSPKLINSSLNSIARFINMSVNAGVDLDQIDVVAVIHGGAAKDIMNNGYYQRKYQVDNPNLKLIQDLAKQGVDFYLCGQTMNARSLPRNEIIPEVKLALSAMTVIGVYVSQGFALIKF